MSNTPLAGKTYRWGVEEVIVVLKACGADEARLRDESYLLEDLRRIDAEVMDQWVKSSGSSGQAARQAVCGGAVLSRRTELRRGARRACTGRAYGAADYVFSQAWRVPTIPRPWQLARTHGLVVNPALR